MKKFLFYIALIAVFPLFWNGKNYCKEATGGGWIDTNLIYNPDFEFISVIEDSTVDVPSDTCWHLNYMPNFPMIEKDAPVSGNTWSLGLMPAPDSLKGLNADYFIKGISGTNSYSLNLWWKVLYRNPLFITKNAYVIVGKYSGNTISNVQTLTIATNDTIWAHDSLSFSLTTSSTDTIILRLCGGISKPNYQMQADGIFAFDKVQLIKH